MAAYRHKQYSLVYWSRQLGWKPFAGDNFLMPFINSHTQQERAVRDGQPIVGFGGSFRAYQNRQAAIIILDKPRRTITD